AYDVQVADVARWKNGPGELCVTGWIELQQKDTAGVGGCSLCADRPGDNSSAVRGQSQGSEVGVYSGLVVALPDQRSCRVKLEDGDFGFRVRGRDSVAYLAPDNVAAVCCLPD